MEGETIVGNKNYDMVGRELVGGRPNQVECLKHRLVNILLCLFHGRKLG